MDKCQICAKAPVSGQNIRHIHSGKWKFRAPRTKRTFKPNIQKITIAGLPIYACTACMRTLLKEKQVKEKQA